MPKTLIPPPPDDVGKAPIENVLELTSLKIIDKDLFTNTRPLWHPPGARGIYGGAAIAQSLAAAQLTIPPPSPENGHAKFYVHSMHCYFVLAGDADIPVIYSVERVRDGRSFITRTVQARQEGRCIFTTTLSFSRERSGIENVEHEAQLPAGVVEGLDRILAAEEKKGTGSGKGDGSEGEMPGGPFEHRRIALTNGESQVPSDRGVEQGEKMEDYGLQGRLLSRKRQLEIRGDSGQSEYIQRDWNGWGETIPPSTGAKSFDGWTLENPDMARGPEAGMTSGGMTDKFWKRDPVDSDKDYGAASKRPETKRTHQWVKARGKITAAAGQEAHLSALAYMSDSWFIGTVARVNNLWRFSAPRSATSDNTTKPAPTNSNKPDDSDEPANHAQDMAKLEDLENHEARGPPRTIGMMVSLDHTIYFHKPAAIKADEWLFQEMDSPWAGDGRGLVLQKIWNREGELLATCIQEGVVRLQQQKKEKGKL